MKWLFLSVTIPPLLVPFHMPIPALSPASGLFTQAVPAQAGEGVWKWTDALREACTPHATP